MPRTADSGLPDRLLEVAGPAFEARGVRSVGMAEIAAGAACGKHALYRCYPSKAHLVAAWLGRRSAALDLAAERAIADVDDPAVALVRLVRESVERQREPGFRGCPVRNYLSEHPDGFDEPGPAASGREGGAGADPDAVAGAWLEATRVRVRDLVARTGVADPDYVADVLWLLLDGLEAGGARHGLGASSRPEVAVQAARVLVGLAS